ncbi:MAG TPA: CHAT domain-containing protein [Intrasporangium sp.]|uniref:CHAT domain-containing protein n=1 Tax=Intrasporangium sp. TaxID=1925024 RepID=UPI002D76C378|nr:CHAT domain-containing protein [Intrasporangium sp.]HET7397238.1 CHAT domain-containing protein [Intrasporangium sp.]
MRDLRERAAADNLAGRPTEAAAALDAALAELDRMEARAADPEVARARVKTVVTYGLTDFLLSGLGAALDRLALAERLATALGDAGLLARVHFQRAAIHGRAGDLAAAWRDFDGVLPHLDAFTEREQCSVLLGRGMLALKQARAREAGWAFSRAADLAGRLGFVEQEVMARHNQGYAAHLLGDLPRALSLMASAAERGGRVARAPMQLDRAHALLEAGLVREAVGVLVAGRAELADEGDDLARGEFDLDLAKANRVLGRLDRATEAAEQAVAAYGRVGATAWAARARLAGLQARLDGLRATSGADPSAGQQAARAMAVECGALVATASAVGDRVLADTARVAGAEALLLAGDAEAAARRLADTAGPARGSLSDVLAAAAVEASVHASSGRQPAARRVLAGAARRLAAGQRGSASLDLRTARAVHGIRLADLDLDLALGRGGTAVLQSLERWRSATGRLPRLGRPDDERLAELTDRLRAAHAAIRAETDTGRLRDLHERAARLERLVRARDWTLASQAALPSRTVPGVREARAVLAAADRDLVWFFAHRGRLCAVGVHGGRTIVRDLLDLRRAAELAQRVRADLRVAASHRLGPLAPAVWGSLRSAADELDGTLLRPWGQRAAGLVVVACHELSALPWSLLPSASDRPVTVARSLSGFATGARRATSAASVHVSVGPGVARGAGEAEAVVAAWGGPGRGSDGRSRGGSKGGSGALAAPGPRVTVASPSSGAQLLSALSAVGPATSLGAPLAPGASGVLVAPGAPGAPSAPGCADIVHVAAHGVHQPQSPLLSSVVLDDGPLFAHEMQPRGVSASHVVLSACDVGTPTIRPGEEALGMAASMLSLGAASVIAAVAPVPDDVAAEAMALHHRSLASGLASDEALATALAGCDPLARAFVCLGASWRPTSG